MKRRSKQPERSFPFLRVNERERKPRKCGLTEIRGPYYSVVGRRYLEDFLEIMDVYVDSLKFAGLVQSHARNSGARNHRPLP
jgi:phosphosulfolactate synthase (CoM biosynthesis protein A)